MKTVTPRKCIIIVIYSKMTQKYRTLSTTSTVAGRPTNSWLEKTKHRSIKQKASSSHRNAITSTHAKELKKKMELKWEQKWCIKRSGRGHS